MKKKLLLVMPHPDDESFTTGGTAVKYTRAGWNVSLVCATRGEVGSTGPYTNLSPDKLGVIRQKELEKAAQILGLSSVTFLDYRDGSLPDLHAGELEDKVFNKMREIVPDVVITFEPFGITNHPDHIKLTLSTTYAFQKYAKMRLNESPDEGVNTKLYYSCVPESITEYLKKRKAIPAISFGKPSHGTPDKFITTVIDISRYTGIKIKALKAHVTQRNDVNRFLSLSSNPIIRQEHFILRLHGIKEVFMGKHDRISNRL